MIMIPPNGQRHEHAEHGVRSRIIACRQRLRRRRAAQKASGDAAGIERLMSDELLVEAVEDGGDVESAGLLPETEAVNRYLERHR